MPDEVRVERGLTAQLYDVALWEEDAIALLHDLPALEAWLGGQGVLFDKGLDTPGLELRGDGHDLTFTLRQLATAEYQLLAGRGYWFLQDEDESILEFYVGGRWAPP